MGVGFDPSTGESTGLANEWELILEENDTVRQDKEKNPQVVTKTIEFSQETARALGKTADKDMATSPTTGGTAGGNYDLGEGLRNTDQTKDAGANQATPSREKNQDSGVRAGPFNTLAQGASQDSQSTEIAKGAQQSADPWKRVVKRYTALRGLRQGLLSTSGKRSEASNALALSGKILEKPGPRTSGAFSEPVPETDMFKSRSDEHSQAGELNRDSPLAPSEGSGILGRSLDVWLSTPLTVSQPPKSLRHRLQKTVGKKSSGLFHRLRSTISRASSLGTAVTPRSRGGSTGTPLEMPQSPIPSTSRPPRLFSIEEIQEGLVSDTGKRSEALNALDFTGRLSERTSMKSYGGFSEVSQAKLGNRVVFDFLA
ncbi:hypothetical protein FRC00_001576 [Tulasnella sp. 408]|nr:hypothetical protein FRC00_001576 [Tulasnella sp. 408]